MVQMKFDFTGDSIDVNKSSGIAPYEGPLPRQGVYAAEIRAMSVRISQAGNPYFNVLFEVADQRTPEKQIAKGYPAWEKFVPGDSDIQKEKVAKLINAICGRLKANVDHEEVTAGGRVTKVGGKEPIGTRVKITLVPDWYNGEERRRVSDVFAWPKDEEWPTGPEGKDDEVSEEDVDEEEEDVEDSEEDVEDSEEDVEEDEEDEDEVDEYAEREAELAELDRPALRTALKESNPDFRILKRHTDDELREAILAAEFAENDEEGDDEPPF